MRYQSISSPTKVGVAQYVIELILGAKYTLPQFFWSKKRAVDYNHKLYVLTKRVYPWIISITKLYSDDVVVNTIKNFKIENRQKLVDAIEKNRIKEFISTIKWYCNEEIERQKRVLTPKDDREAAPLSFEAGEDCRGRKPSNNRINIWELINGKEES